MCPLRAFPINQVCAYLILAISRWRAFQTSDLQMRKQRAWEVRTPAQRGLANKCLVREKWSFNVGLWFLSQNLVWLNPVRWVSNGYIPLVGPGHFQTKWRKSSSHAPCGRVFDEKNFKIIKQLSHSTWPFAKYFARVSHLSLKKLLTGSFYDSLLLSLSPLNRLGSWGWRKTESPKRRPENRNPHSCLNHNPLAARCWVLGGKEASWEQESPLVSKKAKFPPRPRDPCRSRFTPFT